MKKGLRKISLILLVITALCPLSNSVSVFGSSQLSFDMNQLGITADMKPETREQEYVRRDEFAQMTVNMMMQQKTADALKDAAFFSDIDSSVYKGAINTLAKLGYVSGSGTGTYSPDGYLTYGAACKILVFALGYDKIADGTSLGAYQNIAANIRLSKNVDLSQPYMTFEQTMIMFDNALDIGIMSPVYYNGNTISSYEVDEDKTYRNMIYDTAGNGTVKMRGTVTADASMFIYTNTPNMKKSQIEIEGKIYNCVGAAPLGLVGQNVDFYITKEDYEDGKIVAIEPTGKNTVYDFEGSSVTKASSDEIVFEINGVKNTVKFNSGTRYIYNCRPDLSYKIRYSDINDNVVIRTVDSDSDGIAELVLIYEYANCVAESVSKDSSTITLKNGYTLGGEKNIKLDDDKIYYEIYDAYGNLTDIDAIKENAVLSIAKSTSGDCIRIVVCTDTAGGILVSKSGNEIVADNSVYECAETINPNKLKIGSQLTLYLNFLGKAVYYDETKTESKYAYVYAYNAENTFGNYKVKLLLPAPISVKKIEGETDDMSGEVSTSQALYVRNSDVAVYETEGKIIYNSVKTDAGKVLSNVMEQPVSYEVNGNGKIYKIDTLSAVDDVRITSDKANPSENTNLYNKLYNGTELIFGGKRGGAFAIEQDRTMAFCVPKYTEAGQTKADLSDDDLKVMMELKTSVGYEANGYEQDEDTLIADVLVVQQIMQSGQAGNVQESSDVGLVRKVSTGTDDDGSEILSVTMLTKDGEKKFSVSSLISNRRAFESLGSGDLIAYTLDGFDCLNGVKVLHKSDEYAEDSDSDYVCATVKNIEYNRISNNKVRWVHIVQVGFENESGIINSLEILVRNPIPIFVAEPRDEMRTGDITDLQTGDRIYAVLNLDKVRAIVIKR